jgi:hypothetical protein
MRTRCLRPFGEGFGQGHFSTISSPLTGSGKNRERPVCPRFHHDSCLPRPKPLYGRLSSFRVKPRNKPSLTQPTKFLSCSVAGSEKDHATNKCLFRSQSRRSDDQCKIGNSEHLARIPRAATLAGCCGRLIAGFSRVGTKLFGMFA